MNIFVSSNLFANRGNCYRTVIRICCLEIMMMRMSSIQIPKSTKLSAQKNLSNSLDLRLQGQEEPFEQTKALY